MFNVQCSMRCRGFTLIELLVTIGVLAVVFLALIGIATNLLRTSGDLRFQTIATAVVNERIEIARTLPYADVGTTTGIPRGKLTAQETVLRNGLSMTITTTVRNVDDPFDGTIGGSPKDTAPADYKKIEITVACASCPFPTRSLAMGTLIAPKNLEVSRGNGALFIRVLDAVGAPVPGANVHIENQKLTPNLTIDDVTDAQGMLQLVDIPPSTGGYNIRVSKPGYSTDATYPPGGSDNPNPNKTDSTVLKETVTETDFFIDRMSTLTLKTLTDRCVAVPNATGTITGTKTIGTNPEKIKFTQAFTTDGNGQRAIPNLEWGTYMLEITGTIYSEAGSIPQNPLTIAPGAAVEETLIVDAYTPRNLLVTVFDDMTDLPLPGAMVSISKGSTTQTRETGKGFVAQTDWSGGRGQQTWIDETRYADDSGTVDGTSSPGNVLLRKQSQVISQSGIVLAGARVVPQDPYTRDGILESSTIDFGSYAEYVTLRVTPGDQPPATGSTSVRLQIATNNDGMTWNFVGPDGTPNTYFTTTAADIPSVHKGNRYLRYRLFLHTDDPSVSPTVSEVQIVFVSQCMPPGQAFFRDLSNGQYTLTVRKEGYATIEEEVQVESATKKSITLAP